MEMVYLVFVLSIWYGLTRIFKKVTYKLIARNAEKSNVNIGLRASVFLFWVLWFGLSFWYAGGRDLYYDAHVYLMCRNDGGVKVYETVLVSKNRYINGVGKIAPYKQFIKPADEYYQDSDDYYYRTGQPDVWRSRHKVIRRSDGKVLGESIFYSRRGGNFQGPWHESNYGCPKGSPGLT